MTRKSGELKFNPIKFDSFSFNGSVGEKKHPDEFFRSVLSQNICYCVRHTAKTIPEIADDLGVSPVYVEAEAEFLERYGFLRMQKDKYTVNFIINEPTAELLTMEDTLYKHAAELFASALYDELTASGLLENEDILCNHTLLKAAQPFRDTNFLLWALIPFIIANAAENSVDGTIPFPEAATMRPDGAYNICQATVMPEALTLPEDYVYMKNWRGPMWNKNGDTILWQIDSEWSAHKGNHIHRCAEEFPRVLSLYAEEAEHPLSKDDYAWLAERGYIHIQHDSSSVWKIVVLKNAEIKQKLLAVGERIKERYRAEFDALKAPYTEAVLQPFPPHIRKMKAFELQFMFHSDGMFLLHCLNTLLKNGKLKVPTEEQAKTLTTVIAPG